jgi:ABC-type dipeptide/oligopeptide/nickel transport system permease subunit
MTTRGRIAIVLAAALALAATKYGQAMSVTDFGLQRDVWDWGALAAFAFALVGVVLVNRWWALLPAVAPSAVTFYLYSFTDYSTPWDSEGLIFPSVPLFYAAVLIFAVGLSAAVLAIGFLPRPLWRAGRRLVVNQRGRQG